MNAGDFIYFVKKLNNKDNNNNNNNNININDDSSTYSDDEEIDFKGSKTIGIVPICGILIKGQVSDEDTSQYNICNIDEVSDMLDDLASDDNVSDIVLYINSPGGEITGIPELARKISEIDLIKPVYAWTETMSCSAAYWLQSQARILGMTPSSEIGNVGVFLTVESSVEAFAKAGIKVEAFSVGEYKLMGHNFHDLTEPEKIILQKSVVDTYTEFTSAILEKRTILKTDLQGLSYNGQQAILNGYVDIVEDSFESFLTTITNNIV